MSINSFSSKNRKAIVYKCLDGPEGLKVLNDTRPKSIE